MSRQTCASCKHRLPKSLCGFSKSPFYEQNIEQGETTCEYFEENPAIQYMTDALQMAMEGGGDSGQIIEKYEKALEIGLPEDDEVATKVCLGDEYAKIALNSDNANSSPEASTAIQHIETAIQIDKRGSYNFFLKPANRSLLQKYDVLTAIRATSYQERNDVNGAITYAKEKIEALSYLPSPPMLMTLSQLAGFYVDQDKYDEAEHCSQQILNAEPVVPNSQTEQGLRERAQKTIEGMREIKEELSKPQSSGGGCYIATACYGSYDAPEVMTLRQFRDETLSKSLWGKLFIKGYYAYSPSLASWLGERKAINALIKKYVLDKLVSRIREQ